MIKSFKKDDINSIPFVVSKQWHSTTKNPQDLLIIEISDEFYWDYEDSLPWDDPDALWDEEE